jgi:hypothetical protein
MLAYYTQYQLAERLDVTPQFLGRITGTIFMLPKRGANEKERTEKFNIGLNLKFSKKNEEVKSFNNHFFKIF